MSAFPLFMAWHTNRHSWLPISDVGWLLLYITYLVVFLIFPVQEVCHQDIPAASSIIILAEQVFSNSIYNLLNSSLILIGNYLWSIKGWCIQVQIMWMWNALLILLNIASHQSCSLNWPELSQFMEQVLWTLVGSPLPRIWVYCIHLCVIMYSWDSQTTTVISNHLHSVTILMKSHLDIFLVKIHPSISPSLTCFLIIETFVNEKGNYHEI